MDPNTTDDKVKDMITKSLNTNDVNDVLEGDICLKKPELNPQHIVGEIKKYAIFTCVSREIAQKIIEEMKNENDYKVMEKYSKGMLAYIKSE